MDTLLTDLFRAYYDARRNKRRKGKGTLHGIERLEHHIRSVSQNYTRPAYILKLDVQGYFMSINRVRLRGIVRSALEGKVSDFVLWLTDIITMKNPLQGCRRCGNKHDWDDLPDSKSLFCQNKGVGLPIGDLTSQLFSNIFLGKLDWYVVHTLGIKPYGRYVDDFYLIDESKERLREAIPLILKFLYEELVLTMHPKKVRLQPIRMSIPFLGAVIYPHYRHISSRTTHKFYHVANQLRPIIGGKAIHSAREDLTDEQLQALQVLSSYTGYYSHAKAHGLLCRIAEPFL